MNELKMAFTVTTHPKMTGKATRRFICVIIICLFCISNITVHSYPVYNCTYWYSNSNKVGHWFSTPKVSCTKYGNDSTFIFYEAVGHARSQWSNAGRGSDLVTSPSNADIKCYGGTYDEILDNTGVNVSTSYAGLTYPSSQLFAYLEYNGTTKQYREMQSATVYIINLHYSSNASLYYKNTVTHELGHAFGWHGHSSNSNDIMYYMTTTETVLSNRDKNHLCQVFN